MAEVSTSTAAVPVSTVCRVDGLPVELRASRDAPGRNAEEVLDRTVSRCLVRLRVEFEDDRVCPRQRELHPLANRLQLPLALPALGDIVSDTDYLDSARESRPSRE